MGPGPGLAHVLWRYCMRLASSGVGGVRRVRLAFGRHPMHPPHTPDDASRIQNIIHKTQTQLPTYNNDRRTRRTPPTPDDASRMRYRNKTCATSPGPGPTVCVYNILVAPRFKNLLRLEVGYPALRCHILNNQQQQVTRTQHTRKKQRRHRTAKHQTTHTHTRHTHATTSDNGLVAVVRVVVAAHKIVVGGLTRAAPPRAATWWG